jgi:AcrR family transcriptional regulator
MTRKNNSQQTIETIINVSAQLFAEKGYEHTTMQDIVNDLGMSKGAIFHHFKSKEDIMEAVINRYFDSYLLAVRQTAEDKSIPVCERLMKSTRALQVNDSDGRQLLSHLHSPQNALIHLKMDKLIMEHVPPILADIVRDGVEQGLFDTQYPHEAMEMILCYANAAFDIERMSNYSREEQIRKSRASIDAMERLLGAKTGSLSTLVQLFEGAYESYGRNENE